jgi:hypothetical protein
MGLGKGWLMVVGVFGRIFSVFVDYLPIWGEQF